MFHLSVNLLQNFLEAVGFLCLSASYVFIISALRNLFHKHYGSQESTQVWVINSTGPFSLNQVWEFYRGLEFILDLGILRGSSGYLRFVNSTQPLSLNQIWEFYRDLESHTLNMRIQNFCVRNELLSQTFLCNCFPLLCFIAIPSCLKIFIP